MFKRTFLLLLASSLPAVGALAAPHRGKMPTTTASPEALAEYQAGMALLDRVQLDLARPRFEKAVALDPGFVMAWFALARSQARLKDSQALFLKIEDMVPGARVSDGERIFLNGFVAGRNNDREASETATRNLAEMYPDDERCQRALGDLHYGKREIPEAVAAYENGLKANPDYVPIYNILGYCYRDVGETAKAEHAFKRAITLDRKNPNGYDSYGELLMKLGRYQDSIESYEHALELDPLFPSAVMGIASNLMHLERHEDARKRLRAIDAHAPHDGIRSGLCWAAAVTYVDQGDLVNALSELQRNYELSKKINDHSAMAIDLRNIGTVQTQLRRYDDARHSFARALEEQLQLPQPDNVKAISRAFGLYFDGRVEAAAGNVNKAQEISDRFTARVAEVSGGPGMAQSAHELAGIVALAQDRFDVAITELDQANPVSADNMFRLAQAYEGKGDTRKARALYTYVVEYRGNLNLGYSTVRHEAAQRLTHL